MDEQLDQLFARGIDPGGEDETAAEDPVDWPDRDAVRAYGRRVDARIEAALERLSRDDDRPLLADLAVPTCIEHELMHHETLGYLLHALAPEHKRPPRDLPPPIVVSSMAADDAAVALTLRLAMDLTSRSRGPARRIDSRTASSSPPGAPNARWWRRFFGPP